MTNGEHTIKKVVISSTSLDLEEHRDEVRQACEECGCLPLTMEALPSSERGSLEASHKLVDEADIYIGVFAFRYGDRPTGSALSFTHHEYERAKARGIPRLIFLMSVAHPILPIHVETGPGAKKLEKLKKQIQKETVVKTFLSKHDLHAKVVVALNKALQHGVGPSPPAMVNEIKPPTAQELFDVNVDVVPKRARMGSASQAQARATLG